LKLTGDGAANSVTLTEISENSYQITGIDDTVIRFNGQDGASVAIDNVIKGVSLDMAGGDDSLLLTGISVTGNLSAQMGEGNNTVTLTDVSTTGDLTLGGLKGNDTITATDSTINVSGLISISLGDGSNVVDLSLFASSSGKGLNYAGGTGSDDVTIDAPEVSFGGKVDFKVGMGGGAVTGGSAGDTVSLVEVRILGGSKLDLGAGADTVRIDDSTFNGAVTILTGAGEDEVNIETNEGAAGFSRFFGAVSFDLGADDDLFSIAPVESAALLAHFFSTVTVNGGAGTGDEFESGDAAKLVYSPTLTGFEVSSSNQS